MSKMIYIASDIPLKAIENPHYKTISINEALAIGMKISDIVLQDEKLDRDEPMVLWTDLNEEVDDNFSITPFEKNDDAYILTTKQYCAQLEWERHSNGCAGQVIDYIKELLEYTDEVEIWNIWLGKLYPSPRVKTVKIYIDELTAQVLSEIENADGGEDTVLYSGHIPDDWGISDDEMEAEAYYCFTIVRR